MLFESVVYLVVNTFILRVGHSLRQLAHLRGETAAVGSAAKARQDRGMAEILRPRQGRAYSEATVQCQC